MGKLYYCQEGEAHYLSNGAALASDHTCEDITLPKAIVNYLVYNPNIITAPPQHATLRTKHHLVRDRRPQGREVESLLRKMIFPIVCEELRTK